MIRRNYITTSQEVVDAMPVRWAREAHEHDSRHSAEEEVVVAAASPRRRNVLADGALGAEGAGEVPGDMLCYRGGLRQGDRHPGHRCKDS